MNDDDDRTVAVYEDARILANIAVWAVQLQINRLRSEKNEIPEFVMQSVVDFHFLVTALTRLGKAAELVAAFSNISREIKQFDDSLPDLSKIRNVQEHIDEYRLGEGHNKQINANELLTIVLDHDRLAWLGYEIRVDVALRVCDCLFQAIRSNPPAAYLAKIK
jgi:hypothetical protein